MDINTVTIIGANGTMGTNVAAIFAAFGNAKVYMVSRSLEKSQEAIGCAVKSVRAEAIGEKLVAVDYTQFEKCVSESDLVFESVAERFDIKKEINIKIANVMREDAIVCSGTSGLSITQLAECFPENLRGQYYGVHMFNPPYNMSLCELIPTKYSEDKLTEVLKKYLQTVLLRSVVLVKDSPAFLANRIGFYFINRAFQYSKKYMYNGGIDYIDSILGAFSGRAMSPLVTADFVGLDVHKAIVDNIQINTHDYENETFLLPEYVATLIKENKLGRKSGCGLYKSIKNEDGTRTQYVYDIASDTYRLNKKYDFPFVKTMITCLKNGEYEAAFLALLKDESLEAKICVDFLLNYIVYSLVAAREVGDDIHSADVAMATGFNWCPPLAMVDALSTVTDVKTLVLERVDKKVLSQVNVDELFSHLEKSRYDYRPFFKAR